MGDFKEDFYHFLRNEIRQHEEQGTAKEPFLYGYLKRKKEEDPRLAVLSAYLQYLQNGCADPRTMISAAAGLLCKGWRGSALPPGSEPLLAVLEQTGAAGSASEALAFLSDTEKLARFFENADARSFPPALCRQLVEAVRAAFPYNEKRNDRYVQLRERDLLFRCEESPDARQYFLYLLNFSISYVQPVKQRVFDLFLSVWRGIQKAVPSLSVKAPPSSGRIREQLAALRDFTEEGMSDIPPEAIPRDALHKAAEHLLQTLIEADAAAWMYDAGYSINEKEGAERAPRRPRKADHTMDLLDSFFRERGEQFDGRSRTAFRLKESREAIVTLFALLEEKGRRDVIIPITIDPATGAGLYIVGNDRLKNGTQPKGFDVYYRKHNCSYNVVYPTDFQLAGESGIFHSMNNYRTFQIWMDNLDDAYGYYSAIIDLMSGDSHAGSAYFFYQDVDINGWAPEGCPEAYLKYFVEDRDEEEIPGELDEAPGFNPGKMNASSSYRF